MSLYKTSKYLIIHLKRFKQKSANTKVKIVKMIDFPMILDLNKYLINKKLPNESSNVFKYD
jgi:ubiquitin C-terminal hydrolase